ncbi:MAG: hypothetical protein E7057_04805 [Lentisphaerae bacterium]|nr:hypothetical protein [Lentisphaerota bacterium]
MDYDFNTDLDYTGYEKILCERLAPNLLLAQKFFDIYRNLDLPNKKDIFDIIILKGILLRAPFALDVEKLKSVIETLDTLKASGQLEQVMSVVSFFVEQQKNLYTAREEQKCKIQTQNATKARQDDSIERCLVIEEFLQQVELLRHPQQEPPEEQPKRNAAYSEKTAVRTVFRQNEGDIVEKLKTCGIEKEFEKEFGNCFRFYTDFFIKHTGKTCSGYIKEKRSPRSDESKKRSRNSAINTWKKRHKN